MAPSGHCQAFPRQLVLTMQMTMVHELTMKRTAVSQRITITAPRVVIREFSDVNVPTVSAIGSQRAFRPDFASNRID